MYNFFLFTAENHYFIYNIYTKSKNIRKLIKTLFNIIKPFTKSLIIITK